MDELLMRNGAPFGAEVWHEIDETVEHVARQQLVGRRFLSLVGPLGAGVQTVPLAKIQGGESFHVSERGWLTFTTLSQDFAIAYDELVAAQSSGLGLEMGAVAGAAAALAKAEDEMLFAGLRGAKGAQSVALGEWEKTGGAFAAVASALEKLIAAGVYGPYALVLSTGLYIQTQRVMADTGLLEINQIRELLGGNVYFSPALKAREGILIANAPYNLDLVMAQDMAVAYTANVGLDHTFKLMEKLALRVKRPAAICVLK